MSNKRYEVHTCYSTHKGFTKEAEFDNMTEAYKWINSQVDEWAAVRFKVDVESTYKIVINESVPAKY